MLVEFCISSLVIICLVKSFYELEERFLWRVTTCGFLFLLRTLTLESLAEVLPALSAHPLPTYLGGEKQRTCANGLIWNIADGARPNPEGLSRSFRVAIDSMVG